MVMGRPRRFDLDAALDIVVDAFWRNGYEGTSIADLAAAIGVAKPSIYSAFGDKEELFDLALERYADGPAGYFSLALRHASIVEVVQSLLYGAADAVSDPDRPAGCLTVQATLNNAAYPAQIRGDAIRRRTANEDELGKRLSAAIDAGEITGRMSGSSLALFLTSVIHGMAVQAAGGVGRAQLRDPAAAVVENFIVTNGVAAREG